MMLKALKLTLPAATGLLLVALATAQDYQDVAPVEDATASSGDASTTMPSAESSPDPNARVEMSVGELQQLLNLPPGASLKEYQEDPKAPKALFKTKDQLSRIFKEAPDFIYFPERVDPMIIPWVRERVVAEELYEEALLARAAQDFAKARQILRQIQDQYPNTDSAVKVVSELASLDEEIRKRDEDTKKPAVVVDLAATPTPIPITLPDWVTKNTTGVLIGNDGEPVVVVGSDFLRVGDPVPRYAGVRVKSVAPSEVVYVYQDKEFSIEVVGAF